MLGHDTYQQQQNNLQDVQSAPWMERTSFRISSVGQR